MNCQEFEILLCDYVDGTLHGEQKSRLEEHRLECADCAALTEDVLGAVGFMERAAEATPPPELVTRILFQVPTDRAPDPAERKSWRQTIAGWFQPILQPRFAMGMAMTILSFSMLGQFAGVSIRQLKPADLDPVKVWATLEDQTHRAWERGVKYYENLRLVYEIQSRLKEWSDEEEEGKAVSNVRPAVKTAGEETKSKTAGEK